MDFRFIYFHTLAAILRPYFTFISVALGSFVHSLSVNLAINNVSVLEDLEKYFFKCHYLNCGLKL